MRSIKLFVFVLIFILLISIISSQIAFVELRKKPNVAQDSEEVQKWFKLWTNHNTGEVRLLPDNLTDENLTGNLTTIVPPLSTISYYTFAYSYNTTQEIKDFYINRTINPSASTFSFYDWSRNRSGSNFFDGCTSIAADFNSSSIDETFTQANLFACLGGYYQCMAINFPIASEESTLTCQNSTNDPIEISDYYTYVPNRVRTNIHEGWRVVAIEESNWNNSIVQTQTLFQDVENVTIDQYSQLYDFTYGNKDCFYFDNGFPDEGFKSSNFSFEKSLTNIHSKFLLNLTTKTSDQIKINQSVVDCLGLDEEAFLDLQNVSLNTGDLDYSDFYSIYPTDMIVSLTKISTEYYIQFSIGSGNDDEENGGVSEDEQTERVTKLPVFNAWNLIFSILGITLIYLIARKNNQHIFK